MKIGSHELAGRAFAAPMAGLSDAPFRRLCRRLGAAYAVGEMTGSDPRLRTSRKTQQRLSFETDAAPIVVQLAGADAHMLAQAARHCVDLGAQVVDINMGCPARKVCNVASGSALLRDEALVGRILDAVVGAVDVPVTLKIRTGWDAGSRNATRIARIAQSAGVRMLAIHGRTRACGFGGSAEYDTIADVKAEVGIPVVANGDIDSPKKAREVLHATGADAVMVGRAALERPWIFGQIGHLLEFGTEAGEPTIENLRPLLLAMLDDHYRHHGEDAGVRTARKRVHWLARRLEGGVAFCEAFHAVQDSAAQRTLFGDFLEQCAARAPCFRYHDEEGGQ
jgi:tRNA-dihydrouridine synthase B